MRRVLIIAYYFPPIGGIGSIRASRFAEQLPEFGWEPTILAPESTPHPSDSSLSFPESKVVRVKSLEPTRLARLLARGRSPAEILSNGRGVQLPASIEAAIRSRLFYPDPQLGFYPHAVLVGRRLIRSSKFDLIYSSSFPITTHLIARSISSSNSTPWLAEFRDPWSISPAASPYLARAERLERAIANDAQAVVMPSPAWADHFGHQWSRVVNVVANGCDPLNIEPPPAPQEPILAHVGSYYPGRQSLGAIWQALAELRLARSRLPRIRWVGEPSLEARAEIRQHGLEDAVEITGLLPHREALREMSTATLLFASGPVDRGPVGRGWLPAKLFEYLASGAPLLYVGDPKGDAAEMLKRYDGCFVVDGDDQDAARQALQAGLREARVKRKFEPLSRRARAKELAQLFDSIV